MQPLNIPNLLTQMRIILVPPTFVSRVTTALQLITVIMVFASRSLPMGFDHSWIMIFYWITALFTIVSGSFYIFTRIRFINHAS
ncbi:MAG: hypothetical protein L7F78_10710 [Syntrophales bacterium LBB04]|nr:hypothetical protein [Syntrophales bacterium LBB04]